MAIKANIVIDQGSDWETTIDVTDEYGEAINLTGYTGQAQMRRHYTSTTAYAFTVSVNAIYGEVTLLISANTTDRITAGRYVYDLELTDPNGKKTRVIEGIATITPQVTR